MFKIEKEEPSYFQKTKAKVKKPKESKAWEEIGEIRAKLRADILLEEQSLLCAYCEKEIDDLPENSNIDHFKTRDRFPEETLNYNNLLVSCNSKFHCSHTKDNFGLKREDYVKIVNPVLENPENFFEYSWAGDILIREDLNLQDFEKAEFTIQIFKLDSKSLTEERKKIANALSFSMKYEFPDFQSMTKYLLNWEVT